MTRWIVIALLGAGCSGKPPVPPVETSAGGGAAPTGTSCEAMRPKVEQIYRAEPRGREPARVAEAVADNTTMVMNDCRKAPDKVTACIAAATSVRDLEARCLAPIDDEGTEGDSVAR
jgi:hypothetical protein